MKQLLYTITPQSYYLYTMKPVLSAFYTACFYHICITYLSIEEYKSSPWTDTQDEWWKEYSHEQLGSAGSLKLPNNFDDAAISSRHTNLEFWCWLLYCLYKCLIGTACIRLEGWSTEWLEFYQRLSMVASRQVSQTVKLNYASFMAALTLCEKLRRLLP